MLTRIGKRTLAGIILILSGVSAAVFGATLYTQSYRYTIGTGLTGVSQIDFGSIVPGSRGQKIQVNALNTGSVRAPITISLSSPTTTWDSVFSGIMIEVKTQNATDPVTKACVARGSLVCSPAVDASFRPLGVPTLYDYWITYVAVIPLPSTNPVLQTTWAQ